MADSNSIFQFSSCRKWLVSASNLVRWKTWYDSKIPFFLMCMYYAALSQPFPVIDLISEMAVLLLLLCLYASLGHVVNSYCDREIDLVAGKANTLASVSEQYRLLLVIIIVITSLVTTILFYLKEPFVLFMFYLAIAIAVFYSLPPLRLKERGIFGLVAAAVAQRTLPTIIIFQAMEAWDCVSLTICLLSTLIGFRYIIVHQIRDKSADIRANVQTVATTMGSGYLRRLLMNVVFPLELVTLITALLIMSINLPAVGVIAVIYTIWLALQVILLNRIKERKFSTKTYIESYIESYSVFSEFYYLYWPLLLSALLVERNNLFWIVLVFTIIWSLPRIQREVLDISKVFSTL